MNIIIVGGNSKKSGVITKLSNNLKEFGSVSEFNGVLPMDISNGNLILWWPDIPNKIEKKYPEKNVGSVLICSKVMRKSTTRIDAVSRIFKMKGNAVVLIYKNEKLFEFELVDALNNTWVRTSDLRALTETIMKLYSWTKASKRKSLAFMKEFPYEKPSVSRFLEINRLLALKVAEGCGNRFFGNYSTRCTKLFPSVRNENYYLFSPRNIDKRFVCKEDLVLVTKDNYFGDRKPSVDTPIQIEIYENLRHINYMIHGHAFIKEAPFTKHYFPCGDLREVPEIMALLRKGFDKINLKNHGFLIVGKNEDEMCKHFKSSEFFSLG